MCPKGRMWEDSLGYSQGGTHACGGIPCDDHRSYLEMEKYGIFINIGQAKRDVPFEKKGAFRAFAVSGHSGMEAGPAE